MSRCLVVFGREPVPGRVKTRLARKAGAGRAAEIYRMLLERTLAEAAATGVPVVLSLADPLTGRWEPPAGLRVEIQDRGDLGRRMWGAFQRRFAEGWDRVLLLGSDCPGVTSAILRGAMEALSGAPVVLGPARDGGYWAVGQRAPGCDCFAGVPWSVPGTLEATRRLLRRLPVQWTEVETLADVDTAEDLHLLDDLEDRPRG